MVAGPPRAAGLPPALKELQSRLAEGMSGDAARLNRQLAQLADLVRRGKPHDRLLAGIEAAIAESIARVARRRSLLPQAINYPEELPVCGARERILEAIAGHQVVILAGDTGSGKTTQLPKLCLELGRGVRGMIGHTQPRRIAAQAVASRIAEELGPAGAATVGWQVRFTDRSSPDTLVKLMTDGILLAEIQHDRRLERYDTIIIDEAHERSLNIDFLLGYLKRLLPERPDLKLVITSATIDVERFARHFDGAPVIQVEGRTYPVEVWYRQPPEEEPDLTRAIVAAIEELIAHERGTPHAGRGDILVFHAGERDIRETALALRKSDIAHAEVLPLYSRLSQAEQASVFRPSARAGRRIVLATNVAETSLTVPGIRYVIDPGLARISRYSVRSKVQRLPIEPIARASAEQRKGRCGRISEGICVRLYSEEDFAARPAFTDPEILRTGLASVILQMHALGLGEVGRFPFLDPPEERQVNDGIRLLEELGALDGKRLSAIGRQLARLPVDPRIGRMLLAAAGLGALAEMLVVASFLSVQDPRERPVEKQQAADESHRRFACATSDFVSVLQLWAYAEDKRQELSVSAWRRLCQREFLSFLRLREWRDIHYQLRLISRELGLRENHEPASEETLHRAVLAGMLTHIGTRTEERDYEGVRGRRFNLHPGSFVFRKPPKWVVAAELVETTRLYARSVAAIEPEWVLPWAEHLLKREHHSPHWSARAGKVMASERIRLFGLVLSDKKSVDFGRIDPVEARRLFIQSALVEGDYQSKQKFWAHNRALLAEVEALEAKGRRRDLLVEDRVIHDFYDERLPPEVHDHPSLEKWLRAVQAREPAAQARRRPQRRAVPRCAGVAGPARAAGVSLRAGASGRRCDRGAAAGAARSLPAPSAGVAGAGAAAREADRAAQDAAQAVSQGAGAGARYRGRAAAPAEARGHTAAPRARRGIAPGPRARDPARGLAGGGARCLLPHEPARARYRGRDRGRGARSRRDPPAARAAGARRGAACRAPAARAQRHHALGLRRAARRGARLGQGARRAGLPRGARLRRDGGDRDFLRSRGG